MRSKPEREDDTPSAGINWKLFLLVAGIIGVAFFVGMAMQGDGNSVNPSDVNNPDPTGPDIRPSDPPVAVETATPDVEETETGLKLLKKVGPIKFSPDLIGSESAIVAADYQEKKIEVKDCVVRVVSNSITEPTVFVDRKRDWTHNSGDFCVLIVLRDQNGEVEKSLCKLDGPEELAVQNSIYEFENTHEYYFSKTSVMFGEIGETEFAASQRGMISGSAWENVETWEVRIYG